MHMLKKAFYIITCPIAFVYFVNYSIDRSANRTNITNGFIALTQEVCLPVMKSHNDWESSDFHQVLLETIPKDFVVSSRVSKNKDGDFCSPYKVNTTDGSVGLSFCQDENKVQKCSIGASTTPMSLKERKYLSSVSEFSKWESNDPNKNRSEGELSTPVSHYLCRKPPIEGAANSLVIIQSSSLGNVVILIDENSCDTLGGIIR